MRIAMLIRGPIRPDCQSCLDNINLFESSFEGHELVEYLWAWDTEEARKLVGILKPAHVRLLQEPTDEEVLSIVPEPFQITNFISCYKQYWTMQQATVLHGPFDFVAQFRADGRFFISKDDLPSWLDISCYATAHTRHDNEFTNDQIGIAPPHLMAKAWDYCHLALLHAFMQKAIRPEDVLDWITEMNSVPLKKAPLEIWTLNPDRHILL